MTKEERKDYMRKWREANKDYMCKWREANKERESENARKWRETNKEKEKARLIKLKALNVKELRDYYVKQILRQQGFKSEQITPELIELKRITLKTKRLCRQLKN